MRGGYGIPQWEPGVSDERRARDELMRWTDAMASIGKNLGHPDGAREWAREQIVKVEAEAVRDYLNWHGHWGIEDGYAFDETPGLVWGENGFEIEEESR